MIVDAETIGKNQINARIMFEAGEKQFL